MKFLHKILVSWWSIMRISFITILVDLGRVIDIAIFWLRVLMGELTAGYYQSVCFASIF